MRPPGSPAELERRRRRAMRLLDGGLTLSAVARMVGAAVSAVWQWRETLRRRGPDGLAAKPAPGRPRKLTPRQRQRVPRLLRAGARAYGFSNDLWTARRIATVLEQKLGVAYHPAHVSRLLDDLGWTYQKPERRALERDDAAIAHWKQHTWAPLKKKPGA
jgi:transposase